MKKVFILSIMFLLSNILLYSQPDNIKNLFQKYSGEEAFTAMNLSDASSLLKDIGDAQAKEALKSVKSLRILSFDPKKNKNADKGKQFANELRTVKLDGFNEIMSIQSDGNSVRMFTKKEKNLSEFVMLIAEKDGEHLLMYMNGDFDLNQIGNVGRAIENRRKQKK